MRKLTTLVTLFTSVIIGVATCYVSLQAPCGTTYAVCPDGSRPGTVTCKSEDGQKELNQLASAGAWGLTNSAGNCVYACAYSMSVGGVTVEIGCGSVTNAWTGSKPNSKPEDVGYSCTTQGTGTGTGTGSNPPE